MRTREVGGGRPVEHLALLVLTLGGEQLPELLGEVCRRGLDGTCSCGWRSGVCLATALETNKPVQLFTEHNDWIF